MVGVSTATTQSNYLPPLFNGYQANSGSCASCSTYHTACASGNLLADILAFRCTRWAVGCFICHDRWDSCASWISTSCTSCALPTQLDSWWAISARMLGIIALLACSLIFVAVLQPMSTAVATVSSAIVVDQLARMLQNCLHTSATIGIASSAVPSDLTARNAAHRMPQLR
jgi:hypothetical protein